MIRRPTANERPWLEYLREIGFGDLYGGEAPGGTSRLAVARQTPVAESSTASSPSEEPPPGTLSSAISSPEAPSPADRSSADASPGDRSTRAEALAELALEASACTACALAEGRRSVVFGSGDPSAELMFIGEGPGAEEDRQGLPFVGPAGALLTRIIEAIELTRDQVYIANIVKCRPPRNRDPLPDEVTACGAYLERQIDLVRPRVIVALGKVAAQTLLGMDATLGRMRGDWYSVRGVPTRVTYHPAALLRNSSFRRPTWEDMQIVRDRLREE